jgi:two-component system sensor histidine kinase KdpD
LAVVGAASACAVVVAAAQHDAWTAGVVAVVGAVGVWLAATASDAGRRARVGVLAAAAVEDELSRHRSELVTTVSHELRTPLTLIQGVVDTLSQRWDVLSESERLDLVDMLIDNVASLDSSVLHFVDAARLQRGEYHIEPAWVSIEAQLVRVEKKITSALAGHEVQHDLELDRVWMDAPALRQILEHLLVNAARFSPLGSPIRVRCVLDGDAAVLSVADRGQGLGVHLMATVWAPLERGDVAETGVSRGAGLGLPIVRELARLHGGDADLRSVKGRGTTIWVRIPQPAPTEGGPAGPTSRRR